MRNTNEHAWSDRPATAASGVPNRFVADHRWRRSVLPSVSRSSLWMVVVSLLAVDLPTAFSAPPTQGAQQSPAVTEPASDTKPRAHAPAEAAQVARTDGSAAEVTDQAPDEDRRFQLGGRRQYRVLFDQTVRSFDDEEIKADVFIPNRSGPHPLVVMIHGGAWVAGDKRDCWLHAAGAANAGMVVVTTNYRLAPKVKMPDQLEDCAAAIRWAAEHANQWDADPARLALWGYSAGAHLAAMLALDDSFDVPPLRAVVVGGTPADFSFLPPEGRGLEPVIGARPADKPELYRRYEPVRFAHSNAPPFFIHHGTRDLLVPVTCGQHLADALKQRGASAELYLQEGLGHLMAFFDPAAFHRAVVFLREQLGVSQ